MNEVKTGNRLPNPDSIIKKLKLSDGNSGDTKGDKLRRQIQCELEGKSKAERIKWLRENYSQDLVWTVLDLQI
jgi:hypothetical protein